MSKHSAFYAVRYLTLLRLIPDSVMLAVATRNIDIHRRDSCICGWAIREALGQASQRDAADVGEREWSSYTPVALKNMFGGSEREWYQLYEDAPIDNPEALETAFAVRVREACES